MTAPRRELDWLIWIGQQACARREIRDSGFEKVYEQEIRLSRPPRRAPRENAALD
jgi:hypothetical protein